VGRKNRKAVDNERWGKMKRAAAFIPVILLLFCGRGKAENYTVKGDMTSTIRYELQHQVMTGDGMKQMSLSFVTPQSFRSPTYAQDISDFKLLLKPEPQERKASTDNRGNRIVTATWTKIPPSIDVSLSCNIVSKTGLKTLETGALFPLPEVDPAIRDYLKPTELVQANDPRIRALASRLTTDVKTEFDAVQRVISWVVDHIRYVNPPLQYDALYALTSGKGNCQNFSHLSAALLRTLGIPVRIINGITLNQPFDVAWQKGTLTFKMGQGRHSWIEVWFPDQGWVPCDPQNTQLFVSNRFIRVEVGIDNNETKNDGMLRWAQSRDAQTRPKLQETISAAFAQDSVQVKGDREVYGPKNVLLSPRVNAQFKQVAIAPPLPPPITVKDKAPPVFDQPATVGNLEFPEDLDFAFPRTVKAMDKEQFEMPRNFLVETAEYVTTKLTQYAQTVVLAKPLSLKKVGLALHNFGGEGSLWVEVYQDNNGKPGALLATSQFINLDQLSPKPGYRWTDFEFSGEDARTIMPGNYWIALGFSGSPIVNWFYTYGKPVGPADGTRYKNIFTDDWSGALSYEFNYRLIGLTTK